MSMSTTELHRHIEFYRATLKEAQRAGKRLKTDIETREAWSYFRALLREKRRRELEALLRPHLYN